jgi:hypothetical protein
MAVAKACTLVAERTTQEDPAALARAVHMARRACAALTFWRLVWEQFEDEEG